ncbi:MAG: hypothetical protein AAF939_14745, partial [Planctomycetota bacterium]
MKACQLAEIGCWIATHSESFIQGSEDQPRLIVTSYWKSSKLRVQRWFTALKMFEQDFERNDPNHDPWPALEILIEEILISELLTRVWTAAVIQHDSYHGSDELSGPANSVYISHMEARNRAFRIMIRGRANSEKTFDRLNKLRHRIERWTDLFLGQLPMVEVAADYGFDKNRVTDFHQENLDSGVSVHQFRQKVFASSFNSEMLADSKIAANPDLNREIASGILACFPQDRFDSHGLPK